MPDFLLFMADPPCPPLAGEAEAKDGGRNRVRTYDLHDVNVAR